MNSHPPSWWVSRYTNTIAGSSPGERIYTSFFKVRFASQKIESLYFYFQPKKPIIMTLNDIEITKYCNTYFILFLFFYLHNFLVFTFFYIIVFGRTCYGTTVDSLVPHLVLPLRFIVIYELYPGHSSFGSTWLYTFRGPRLK